MKRFVQLFQELDATTRTNEKLEALRKYFSEAPLRDSAWAVYVLSGRKIPKSVSSRMLRDWAAEVSGLSEWLMAECHTLVGDLSETISLIVPSDASGEAAPSLHEMIEHRLIPMSMMTKVQQRALIQETWQMLNADQRLVFHKLLSGEFRFGVSKTLMIRGLSEVAQVPAAVIAHRLAGSWQPSEEAMKILLSSDPTATDPGVPYPFMLAHAFTDPVESLGAIEDWQIEYKYDGIRAQIIRRSDRTLIWSRGDEMVAGAFPDIVQASATLPINTVLDGELVAWDESKGKPLPFTSLQKRLNRINVELSFWPDVPVKFIAFDVLEAEGLDQREKSLRERREVLRAILASRATPDIEISNPVPVKTWEALAEHIPTSRERQVEGVMLKRLDSTYRAGRPTGLWWKWKIDPYTVDAVMIAAEPGHGRRAGLLTDYTFGVWKNDQLVPIAKAYSGLTDEEIVKMDRFARSHTTERHGPVHMVEPVKVFELGFEAIQESTRHKSGVALRFPRMLRIRDDKTPKEADRIEVLFELLKNSER